jgi:microcystin-dependent protein
MPKLGLLVAASAAVALSIAVWPAKQAHACDPTNTMMGAVCTFAFGFCPGGWLPADGRTLPITSNRALYTLLGNTYGGDGVSTFALPDLRGRAVVGAGAGAGLSAVARGQQIGSQQVMLTEAQVPLRAHSHDGALVGGAAAGPADLAFDAVADLAVSATAYIGTSSTSGRTNVLQNFSRLVHPSIGSVAIYDNANATADIALGPEGGVTGAATGTVSGTASGDVELPVTGSITVSSASAAASEAVSVQSPALGMTLCIANTGYWPLQ